MRVGIIGGGIIARLVLEHLARGEIADTRAVCVMGRHTSARARTVAGEYGVHFATTVTELLAQSPDVVIEAASHEAVREYGQALLEAGVTFIVLSAGALCDDALRSKLERAAREHRGLLYVPSGGIGGLDALKAACIAGVDQVSISISKPPAAWKNIPYVESLAVPLDALTKPRTLYDGTARAGVPLFPANVNIAAVLAMAGIGFDATQLKVIADPGITHNTHRIEIKGKSGNIRVELENVPAPENPKTAWLACYSALAALQLSRRGGVRYGT
jgi:aspartate dehydrogenase